MIITVSVAWYTPLVIFGSGDTLGVSVITPLLLLLQCKSSPKEQERGQCYFLCTLPNPVPYPNCQLLDDFNNDNERHCFVPSDPFQTTMPPKSPRLSSSTFWLCTCLVLAFQAFYNYHVLELLQMLVTGGISSQLEQHLDKDKFCGLNDSYSTVSPGRMRCKLGLLSLNQTILSDIQVSQLFS